MRTGQVRMPKGFRDTEEACYRRRITAMVRGTMGGLRVVVEDFVVAASTRRLCDSEAAEGRERRRERIEMTSGLGICSPFSCAAVLCSAVCKAAGVWSGCWFWVRRWRRATWFVAKDGTGRKRSPKQRVAGPLLHFWWKIGAPPRRALGSSHRIGSTRPGQTVTGRT